MPKYHLEFEITVPATREEVWDFISDVKNLAAVAPSNLKIVFDSDNPGHLSKEGQLIHYRASPFPGIRIKWTSRVTKILEGHFIAHLQVSGPFKYWYHEHHIIGLEDGVRIRDVITYEPMWGVIGQLLNFLFIRRRVTKVFVTRRKSLERALEKRI